MIVDKKIGKEKIERVINKDLKHQDYERVTSIAKDYNIALTGQNYQSWIKQVKRRENDLQFNEKVDITVNTATSVLNGIVTKFNKLARVSSVRKKISITDEKDNEKQILSISTALGDLFKEGKFERFIVDDLIPKSIRDPNGFWVLLYQTDSIRKRRIPYNVFYSSFDVMFYEKNIFGEYEYIVPCVDVVSYSIKDTLIENSKDFWLYGGRVVLRYEQIYFSMPKDINFDQEFLKSDKFFASNLKNTYNPSLDVFVSEKGVVYQIHEYSFSTISNIQVFPSGTIKDPVTEERTYISIINRAIPFLKKLVNVGSTLELSILLHAFPRLIQFSIPCSGPSEDTPCTKGKLVDGTVCPKCKGTGKEKQLSPDDTLELEMPDDPEGIFDVSNLIKYVNQDMSILEFLEKHESKLEDRLHSSIFNTDKSPHSTLTAVGDAVTATEVSVTREDINDTYIVMADYISSYYSFAVPVVHQYVNKNSKILSQWEYPRDLKLSTVSELMNDLILANNSKAPSFVIEKITEDISDKMFSNDQSSITKLKLRRKWIPFVGMSFENVITAYNNKGISFDDFIVFCNQDCIFADLESENNVYSLDGKALDDKISNIISSYIQKVKTNGKTEKIGITN